MKKVILIILLSLGTYSFSQESIKIDSICIVDMYNKSKTLKTELYFYVYLLENSSSKEYNFFRCTFYYKSGYKSTSEYIINQKFIPKGYTEAELKTLIFKTKRIK